MPWCDRPFLLLTALALLLAACQPLPRPFKPNGAKSANPLLELSDAGGIHVLNIDGAPTAVSRKLAKEMANALQALNIPASTYSANERSLFLQGSANTQTMARRGVEVDLRWELIDSNGTVVGRHSQKTVLSDQAWRNAQAEPLKALASSAAPKIANLIQEPAPAGAGATARGVPVHVDPVTGAPGNGDTALRRALQEMLKRAGITVVDKRPEASYVVVGKISMGKPKAGRQKVDIAWSVRDREGVEKGDINQSNTVRVGELDGRWGDIAFLVAKGAADGIAALLRKLPPVPPRAEGSAAR